MATNYPTSLQDLDATRGTSGEKLNDVTHNHITHHNTSDDTVEALQAKVGADSSAVTTSHDYKLSGVTGTDKAVSRDGSETLTNKSISLGSNTVTGTTAQFNTALSDDDFATQTGSETLTNKTLTSPVINTPTLTMANDVAIQAKNAGGTAKDIVKLESDDYVRLSQVPYQTGTPTNSTSENVLIQRGFGFITGDGANRTLQKTVTFPTTYTTIPTVVVTNLGYKSSSDPSDEGDTGTVVSMTWSFEIYDTTTSTALIQLARRSVDGADPGFLTSGTRYIFSWVAIGIK